ncbi:hypothetical protein CA13_58150 [Planctomycetes bacterium CA13]|uniref:Uncharacterized protein n=1 Tax=Novipirellula herctigrandis TaxID=2527986 RepID=A0A5C5ZB15_9BACT|nr:hypothetical protein CA13_58150 [Planctomycetes bacterium CA13]
MPKQSQGSANQRRTSKRVRWLLSGLALIVVLFPGIIARTGMRDRLINSIIGAPNLHASSKGAALGWLSPLSVDGLRMDGKQKRFRKTF